MRYSFQHPTTDEINIVSDKLGYDDWKLVATSADDPDPDAVIVKGKWSVPIETLRARLWDAVKAKRDDLTATAPTPFGIVDADDKSRTNINGLVVMANGGDASFPIDFTLADNSVVSLDVDQMVKLGCAVGSHINDVYARARELRDQIEASDEQALTEVDVEAGWPGSV